jgi:hypothetical protein
VEVQSVAWRNFFQRERRGGEVSFAVTVTVNDGPVSVTISSHVLQSRVRSMAANANQVTNKKRA